MDGRRPFSQLPPTLAATVRQSSANFQQIRRGLAPRSPKLGTSEDFYPAAELLQVHLRSLSA